jgi:hypothetical protein
LASEYIIAVALECAGALNEAELLLDDLEPKAANANVVQHGLKIAQRIPTRRMEICVARANQVYKQWRDSRSDDLLVAIDELLNQVPTSERKRLPWLGLKAIVQVAHEDDLQAAEQTVLSCGREQPTTQMNLAFLKACHGDLRGATRHYRNAKGANVNLELVEEIMDFIEWYRLFKPALDVEMCYCLGFISLEIIKDTILANQYFTRFAEVADDRYRQEQLLVEKWMGELSGE